jgi:Holliday junction resolvase RusA-like endonuclease
VTLLRATLAIRAQQLRTVTFDASGLVEWLKGATTGALLHLSAQTTPSPSHRPRVTRRGITYFAKPYTQFVNECQQQFAEQHTGGPIEGRLAAVIETVVERPRTTKLTDPNGDTDNYAKGPLDALQKAGVVTDDKQLVHLGATRRFAEPGEESGVRLWLGRLA